MKETCIRGHKLSDTAKQNSHNQYRYCASCKTIRQRERRNKQKADGITIRMNKESRKKVMRKYHLQKNYGLTLEDFDSLLSEQRNCCALCKTDAPGPLGWQVDHDHVSGKVRGILCQQCNVGLGNFRDDRILLLRAIDYLKGQ